MIQLVKSPVIFNEEEHTYTLGDKQLSGITSIIKKLIFPDMYSNVSQAVLNKAAERGTRIHQLIEMWQHGIVDDEDKEELKPFFEAWGKANLDGWESEYLVSDNESVASCIDMVCCGCGSDEEAGYIYLCDIKTTAILHMEYLSWQLSIYAYLFELQNPGLKVHGLKAIHFRDGKCKFVDVPRLKDEWVVALLDAYKSGAMFFINPSEEKPEDIDALLNAYFANETEYIKAKVALDVFDKRRKELQEQIASSLAEKKLTKIETATAKVTIGKDTERTTFDLKSFMDSPQYLSAKDEYAPFIKSSITKGRVTITLR